MKYRREKTEKERADDWRMRGFCYVLWAWACLCVWLQMSWYCLKIDWCGIMAINTSLSFDLHPGGWVKNKNRRLWCHKVHLGQHSPSTYYKNPSGNMGAELQSLTQHASSHVQCFLFVLLLFFFFHCFPKTADPKTTNSFINKGLAFAMTLLSMKFNHMLVLFCS